MRESLIKPKLYINKVYYGSMDLHKDFGGKTRQSYSNVSKNLVNEVETSTSKLILPITSHKVQAHKTKMFNMTI